MKKVKEGSLLLGLIALLAVVVVVAVVGLIALRPEKILIQGEAEAAEYRVSGKVPGRIEMYLYEEGEQVKKGDTLVVIYSPEVEAKKAQALAAREMAEAVNQKAKNGARNEQIQGAYELYQKAKAGEEIYRKSYERVQRLYDKGVVSAQKRDEAFAAYKASEAQVLAAKSQYEMAKNGARQEEREAATQQARAAKSAVDEMKSLLRESVQVATEEGEVSEVFHKVGELVGTGSPIMSVAVMKDLWGTFNVREDQLKGMKVGDVINVYSPAFNKELKMKVFYIKDQGSYAVWKATKTTGQYDLKTFEVKARPVEHFEGLRPGMSLIVKE